MLVYIHILQCQGLTAANGTIITFMFHSYFNSLARSRYLSFFSLSFSFILWSAGTAKSTILQILFFVDNYKVWSFVRG